jgi:phage-related protein
MARIPPDEDEKPIIWVGSSLKDLREFPADVMEELGAALSAAQFGGKAERAKPWKGLGSGVLEVVEDYRSDTYRVVYTVRLNKAIYVLHVFQKKSPKGIETDRRDIRMIEQRLKEAQEMDKASHS